MPEGDWRDVRRQAAEAVSSLIAQLEAYDLQGARQAAAELVSTWQPPLGVVKPEMTAIEEAVAGCSNIRDAVTKALADNVTFWAAHRHVEQARDLPQLLRHFEQLIDRGASQGLDEMMTELVRLDGDPTPHCRVMYRMDMASAVTEQIAAASRLSSATKTTLLHTLLLNPSTVVRAQALQVLLFYVPNSVQVDHRLAESMALIVDPVHVDQVGFTHAQHASNLNAYAGALGSMTPTYSLHAQLFLLATLERLNQTQPQTANLWSALASQLKGALAVNRLAYPQIMTPALAKVRTQKVQSLLSDPQRPEVLLFVPSVGHTMYLTAVKGEPGADTLDLILHNRGDGVMANGLPRLKRLGKWRVPSGRVFAAVKRSAISDEVIEKLLTPMAKPSQLYAFLSTLAAEQRPSSTVLKAQGKGGACNVTSLLAAAANHLDRQGAPKSAYDILRLALYEGFYHLVYRANYEDDPNMESKVIRRLEQKIERGHERLNRRLAEEAAPPAEPTST